MNFRITGLSPEPFRALFGLSDAVLATRRAKRYVASADSGFPDRIELRDAAPGESVILVNYEHQPADNPYRARHAIFVLEGASAAYDRVGEVPAVMSSRQISLRAFGADDMMVDAHLGHGRDLERAIADLFANREVAYVHAHYATRGCYAALVTRA